MQGVIVSFDPITSAGVVMCDTPERDQYALSAEALEGSIFKFLRQGQRVNFELNEQSQAINIRTGAEGDMGISTARV